MAASIALISPYDLGRQPFAIAEPAALLKQAGYRPVCIDLSQQKLDSELPADARVVFIHLGMLTATRIAIEALPRIRKRAASARIAVFGWYAPINSELMRELGADAVFGGESDQDMVDYVQSVIDETDHPARHEVLVNLGRVEFALPERAGLPALDQYASLVLPDGRQRTMGFTDTTRGCKHLCRHCPVVPVYHGRFRAVPADIVLADIDQQVGQGAEHISFGDPDFLNGPTHALRIVRAMHADHPDLTWDAVIKIEHLLKHADRLSEMKENGCILITTAVEAVDEYTLQQLDKGHTAADFESVVALMRRAGIALAPTFVPFTPWTTIDNFRELIDALVRLKLIESVNPVQLSLRLLIPAGSRLLELPRDETCITAYKPASLGYEWAHRDPSVDRLQQAIRDFVEKAEAKGLDRLAIFNGVRDIAYRAAGLCAEPVDAGMLGDAVPYHSEAWYCCAEPTEQQLESF
jgi:radical SAM superfamily enzyme YgiQ (UPF0313 family)